MEKHGAMPDGDVRELVLRARGDDSAAFEQLMSLYEPMLAAAVHRYAPEGQEEDARQEALAGFYRAVLSFDVTQPGVAFGLYAKICVSRALISHARDAMRRARQTVGSLDYEEYLRCLADAASDPAQQLIDEESIRSLRRLIRDNLSDYENRVWDMYIAGASVETVAASLGRSERSINNALYRIRRKLRELLEASGRMG